jgi:putative endopeptidase
MRALQRLFGVLAIGLVAGAALASRTDPVSSVIRPGDDFDQYASHAWASITALPSGQSSFGPTTVLIARNAERVRTIIENAASSPDAGGGTTDRALRQKVGDFYSSIADGPAIEAKALSPLAGELAAIASIRDRQLLSAQLGRTLRLDDGSNTQTESILGLWVHQGFTDADRYLPHLVQGGLGLGPSDSYLDPAKADVRERYRAHVAQILSHAGVADAEARATDVVALETAIARTHASRAETDDPFKTNNLWRRPDFDTKAPGVDWSSFFDAAGLGRQSDFIVWQRAAVSGISALVASQPIETWKAYLTFHLIDHYAPVLPATFARFAEPPLSNRHSLAIAVTNAALGDAVGRLYAERYFPPRAKAAAQAMAANLRSAFRTRIPRLTWMAPQTRAKALAKLAALEIGVGYPDHWIDYAPLRIVRGDAFGNFERVERFTYGHALAKLGRPVDPAEWSAIAPQTVGAVINFSPNAIQFSAGILQPPYFDPVGDAASNYGSAGAGMAHEISHSFDLLGNLYDARGRLGNWWSAEDLDRYRRVTSPLARQYDAYCPRPGLCLDGKRLLGEDVADLAGLRVAFDAYHLSLHGRPDRIIDGLSGDQRFFLAFARRWRKLQTEAALRQQVASDIHAPGPYRSATVRNLGAWYRAFGVRRTDRLYLDPRDRVGIW